MWCACLAALVVIHNFDLCHASEGSNDSGDNNNDGEDYEAQDYRQDDDLESDWYFDDPYARVFYPTDDGEEEQRSREERKEYIIQLLSAGSCALFGLMLGSFCTSVSLYCAKKTALVIRYDNEGIVVEANILASEPNIEGLLKNEHNKSSSSSGGEVKILAKRGSDGTSEQAIHDSYTIMSDTDDDDDDTNYASHSSSTTSSSSSESAAAAGDVDSQQDGNNVNNLVTPRLSNRHPAADKKQNDFESLWKEAMGQQYLHSTQRFVVVVEYKDAEYASRIRKRLMVMGNDIKLSGKEMNKSSKVLLYVLRGSPKSGQCCGEIHRALKWNMQLSFFFLLSFCIVLTIVTVVSASKMLSQNVFVAYLCVLLLLVSLQIICLDAAFTNIIAKQYLENGRDLPVGMKLKNSSFERKEMDMTLKHDISYV